jgi:Fe-S-cluster containining protein
VRAGPRGGLHLVQPCTALEGAACRCYQARPLACRRYRCALLAALEAGEVELTEALEVVAAARAEPPSPEREALLTFHFGRR